MPILILFALTPGITTHVMAHAIMAAIEAPTMGTAVVLTMDTTEGDNNEI